MSVIAPIVTQMVIEGLSGRMQRPAVAAVAKTEVALGLLSAFLLAITAVFLLVALYAYLTPLHGAAAAALMTAATAFMTALSCALFLAAARAVRRRKTRQAVASAARQADDLKDSLIETLTAATEGLEEPVARNPRTAVLLASLAGYVAGNKLH